MTIKHFVNNKRGLSTDTQPQPSNLSQVFYLETDTGAIYLSDGNTTTQVQGPLRTENPTNKIINAEKNTITPLQLIEDSPFNRGSNVKGGIIPAATVTDSFFGILQSNNLNIYNPANNTINSTDGLLVKFTSSTFKDKMGFASPVPITRRSDLYSLLGEFEATAPKVMVGFSTSPNFDPNFVLSNTDKGVAIGYTKIDTNFSVFYNDGTGQRLVLSFPTPIDSNLHTFEILLGTTNIICRIDNGNDITLTTRIPSLTDDLYLLSYGIN